MMEGWYYLHTNGDLIYKRELGGTAADIRESDFAVAMWPFDAADRALAWRTLIEASVFGAKKERIDELRKKWGLTNDDAFHYADHQGFLLVLDGNHWCAKPRSFVNLQESQAGFGASAFDAIVDLARAIGVKPSKMWGATFHDLLKER